MMRAPKTGSDVDLDKVARLTAGFTGLAEAPIEIRLSGISSRDARIFVEANERNALVINARRLTAHDEASI
jgi:hypothetical protein